MKVQVLISLMWFMAPGANAHPVNRFARVEAIDEFLILQPSRLKPLILAHRGGPGPTDTENTIETFKKTVRSLPNAIIEMDVRMTRDSGLVLLHDPTLDRESDAIGPVASHTMTDLQSVRLKTLKGTLTRQHIPTFADVLRWNKNRYMLALDIKPGTDPVWVMRLVHTFQAEYSVFVICYSMADARHMRSQYPDVWLAVGVNSETDLDSMERNPLASGRLVALTPQRLQPPSFYTRLHKLGMPVSTGTYGAGQLDEKKLPEAAAEYRNMATVGVDIITTDRPVAVAGLF